MNPLKQIWLTSAQLNRDSSVYWLNLARTLRHWPEAASFCAMQSATSQEQAEADEQMAASVSEVAS